jgi:hypothetical protein
MFTTIGYMTNACIGDPQSVYFPAQPIVEIADVIVGLAALIIGPILFSQGYHLGGGILIGLSIFQSHIIFGNISALIKRCRLENSN